jgi:iron complex outermembrane receptor protein
MKFQKVQSSLVSSIALLGALSATAQDSSPNSSTAISLEEIVVTAQRREQNLQDVPVSVAAVSGDELADRSINELSQLTQAAPTLQVDQENNFAIRGIGSQIFTQTTDPSVAFTLDGINLGRPGLSNILLSDIASVEVLNGPQGLLFGKNASAGMINMMTKKPELGEINGSFGGEYVMRDTTPKDATGHLVRGILNLPVGENSAFRFNASYSDQEAILENLYPNTGRVDDDMERWGVKAKFLHENGPLSLYLIADMNESNGTAGRYGRTFRAVDPNSDLVPAFAADGIIPGPENLTNSSDGDHWNDEETGGVQATISYELESGAVIENIMGWRYYDTDQELSNDYHSELSILKRINDNEYTQFSNELRFVFAGNDSYSGQAGLYYFTSTNEIVDNIDIQVGPPPFLAVEFPFCVGAVAQPGPPPACNVSNAFFLGGDSDTEFVNDSYAAFGQFDFYLTDRFTATVGARITRDKVTSDVVQGQRDYFIFLAPRATIKESISNTNVSWRLAGKYDLTEDSMIYASLSSGYKGPGFNTDFLDIPEVPFAVKDEVSTTLEIGYKSRHWDDRLVLNVAAFRTEFDDYQDQSFNLEAQGFIIQNAASVTSQGAEVSLTALLSEGFTVRWDVSLVDSTFDDFDAASCVPGAPCAPGDDFWDASGESLPLASDVTSSLQGIYETEISDGIEGFVQGTMYYRSEISYGVGAPALTLDDVTMYNLTAGIRTEDGWKVSLFCKNCTDEKTPSGLAFDPGENNGGLATVNQAWGLDSVRIIGLNFNKEF